MNNRCLGLAVLALMMVAASLSADDPTWRQVDNTVYGAKPDARGPIGGGPGYNGIITRGDYTADNLDALLEALSKAKTGQVVFIPGETEIDLTARVYVEKLVLTIPEGVTLAGDRGCGASLGALLTSDALDTPVLIRAAGPNVRVTGLRIQGPNPKRHIEHHRRAFGPNGQGRKYYYKFPTSNGIRTGHDNLEVDNCDISAFSHAAIDLKNGSGHRIHHNFIHHCQYQGLGYGIVHDTAVSLIEYNRFDWNRHSIAGTGKPVSGYIARHNIELGESLSHCFDMHGGRDRGDGTQIAGTKIEICNNTFRAPTTAVAIRGIPLEYCRVYQNWFLRHEGPRQAVRASEKTTVTDNLYQEQPQ